MLNVTLNLLNCLVLIQTSQQSSNSDDTSLAKTPSFLEIAGHAYFFGGFLVGPLYSIRRYLAFVNGEATGHLKGHKPTW